jgi:hypothetical protein
VQHHYRRIVFIAWSGFIVGPTPPMHCRDDVGSAGGVLLAWAKDQCPAAFSSSATLDAGAGILVLEAIDATIIQWRSRRWNPSNASQVMC